MDDREANIIRTSSLLVDDNIKSNCVDDVGDDCNENRFKSLCINKVSRFDDPILEIEIAEERLEKLDREYTRLDNKYMETRAEERRFYWEVYEAENQSGHTEYHIHSCKRLLEMLQNAVHNLISSNSISKPSDIIDRSLQFLMFHGIKTLAQEKTLLKQKTEISQRKRVHEQKKENTDFKWINFKLSYLLRTIPKYCEKKRIIDLLAKVKEIQKSVQEALAGNALDGNPRNEERLKKSIESEVMVLKKVIVELEKENGERDLVCKIAKQNLEKAETKLKKREKQKEKICERWDEQRKRILQLKRKG